MEVALTQGKIAHIDPEDWPLVSQYRWYAAKVTGGHWYADATPHGGTRQTTKIKMHNLILGQKWVDHRDGDRLNNRRSNLRPCTNAQNQQNADSRGGSSRYKGVSWDARKQKWRVAFRWDGKHYFVGNYAEEVDAAKAYNGAVKHLAGEFARLNPV